ncbi:DNA polymerase III subunit gamma/tau [Anaerocolumna xylanovorans]|uniref:DNA-directed DNA polymerase n=1 Tax=Anaerocolumna xylanovorans DSM 12503 TaxID=1121345 RepID=A0A1M7YMF6_9FIRM|nr:DNA polymerase III subunit gamma/tau [Anaerocolumna xylanovorans]SHO53831.1 DNA polymerase-3 subunit gamma/tau [Anaerocolumna xylanovorans DSM 12503]
MSYTALYRKFRPTDFHDVKGQDHIVTTLKNQIKSGRIGHAYLFCGTRGTGKTTIAKILGKAVNCEHPIDGNPCNECETCRSIQSGASMNVIEIDAASNNGVDNIREIVEEVRYSPTEGRFKVYIIDEVHMLSTGAFNALLKTLEEPPSYVIFILATTEAHKIPITILSRCQRYDFKRITIDTISDRLKELIKAEGVEAEEKAIRYIARMGDGSLRDALSLLDQCIAFYYGQQLTYDKVLEVLGAVDIEVFARLLKAISQNDVGECMGILEELIISGRELTQFTVDFTWYLRNLLLVKTSENASEAVEVSTENLALLEEQAKEWSTDTLIRFIRIFSDLSNQIRYASQKRVMVEVALIKLCRPQMEKSYEDILERIRQLEAKLENGVTVTVSEKAAIKGEPVKREEKPIELPKAVPEDLKLAAKNWSNIVAATTGITKVSLGNARPSIGNNNTLLLVVTDEWDLEALTKEAHMQELKSAIARFVPKEVEVTVKLITADKDTAEETFDLRRIIKNIDIEYED